MVANSRHLFSVLSGYFDKNTLEAFQALRKKELSEQKAEEENDLNDLEKDFKLLQALKKGRVRFATYNFNSTFESRDCTWLVRCSILNLLLV